MNGWTLLLLALLWGAAPAQVAVAQITVTPTPDQPKSQTETPGAAALLAQAQAAALGARSSGALPTPDEPRWRDAVQLGEAARELAPDDLEVLRFLAETYSTLSWDSRAWELWSAYLDAGGNLDGTALSALSEAGRELGYARYSAGDLEGAAAIFERVAELEPDNVEALTWLGRIALEQGRSAAAERYWRRVLALRPGDPTARYYVQQSEQQLTYGAEASGAFNEGLAAYNAGRKAAALGAFTRAATANPDFEEAATWAGRTALELGRPRAAQRFWGALLERDPQNRQAAYFLTLAKAQRRWGTEAGRAFYAGQELYNQGRVEAAAERFVAASDANPQYPEAASWAARSLQESGQAARAVPYWRRLVALNPDDESARYFLEAAQAQQEAPTEAVQAFEEGVQAYQQADPERAQRAFRRATEADPGYADAWGWLGRLAFEGGRYGEAGAAYARALELEPGNATYRFFQAEAERLGAE
jgi:tetratricopeptide (TPR) repeat protein